MAGSIQASPFHRRDKTLAGFVLSGRWPNTTKEWAHFLALAVRLAASPGTLHTTVVFRAIEDVPEDPQPGAVGIVTDEGPVLAESKLIPGQFVNPTPPALFVLHPPEECSNRSPDSQESAAGVILLPGIPHLGLDHRAAWVEAESDGTINRFVSATDVDPMSDPDLAVLATLCMAA